MAEQRLEQGDLEIGRQGKHYLHLAKHKNQIN
jgi:hypothetical protein